MKVLLDHPAPFALAHGGFQIQIEQTKQALERRGVDVDFIRWWDEKQSGQIIHYFGRPPGGYVDLAHQKGFKFVAAELLTGLGSRSTGSRTVQKLFMRTAQAALPSNFIGKMSWDTYEKSDAFIALTEWEATLMRDMFQADPAKIHVIPNGVEPVFFTATHRRAEEIKDHLVCTAAIHPRKRVVELAQAAVQAQVPVWIIGRPYAETDMYYRRLLQVQKANPAFVRYEGGISDRARLAEIYRRARGFVLLSTMESLSLSALEAAAAGCPLLLSDLPWARTSFGAHAEYASATLPPDGLARQLRAFHEKALTLEQKFLPLTWDQVADRIAALYAGLLA